MIGFSSFLKSYVQVGTLNLIDHKDRLQSFVGTPEPMVTIKLHNRSVPWKLLINPGLYLGEAYMDGELTIVDGDLYQLLELAQLNGTNHRKIWPSDLLAWWRRMTRGISQWNSKRSSRKNVAHHYDLTTRLYKLFLDKHLQYTCGYYLTDDDDMETAQKNKMLHIISKLNLQPNNRVIDMGCGWGGLSLMLNKLTGAKVTGVSLSKEQLSEAKEQALSTGKSDSVRFQLSDYRDIKEKFDRLVCVGMLEHIGAPFYRKFFGKVSEILADDGVGLIHTIGRTEGKGASNAWIDKYIFPGGYIPALSEVVPAIEGSGLSVLDVEVWRGHYATTLQQWRQKFDENWQLACDLFDERFCRMWEFYLTSMEAMFRTGGFVVFQIEVSKSLTSLPRTRDFMHETEKRIVESGLAA